MKIISSPANTIQDGRTDPHRLAALASRSNSETHYATVRRLHGDGEINLILDVGANIGVTVSRYLRQFDSASVIAFEPIGATFTQLLARVGSSPRVCCMNLALGRTPGSAQVHLQRYDALNSLYPALNVPDVDFGICQAVEISTLDQIVANNAMDHIDLLKIDTEHLELDVLQGGRQTLQRGGVSFIYAEVTFDPADPRHSPYFEVSDFLAPFGYEVAGFYEQMYYPNTDRLEFCNALFCRTA